MNAESARLAAETERANAEAVRASAEAQRALAEAERKSNFESQMAGGGLPVVSAADDGKVLAVSNGAWRAQALSAESGKSAYDYALEGGFTGTAEEFAEKLAAVAALTVYNGETEDVV